MSDAKGKPPSKAVSAPPASAPWRLSVCAAALGLLVGGCLINGPPLGAQWYPGMPRSPVQLSILEGAALRLAAPALGGLCCLVGLSALLLARRQHGRLAKLRRPLAWLGVVVALAVGVGSELAVQDLQVTMEEWQNAERVAAVKVAPTKPYQGSYVIPRRATDATGGLPAFPPWIEFSIFSPQNEGYYQSRGVVQVGTKVRIENPSGWGNFELTFEEAWYTFDREGAVLHARFRTPEGSAFEANNRDIPQALVSVW